MCHRDLLIQWVRFSAASVTNLRLLFGHIKLYFFFYTGDVVCFAFVEGVSSEAQQANLN